MGHLLTLLGRRGLDPLQTLVGLAPRLLLLAPGTLWQDAAKTTAAVANLDVVGDWPDRSTNATDPTGAGSTRPKLSLAGANGRAAVASDGVDDILAIGSNVSTAAAGAILWAGVLDSLAINSSFCAAADTGTTTNFLHFRLSAGTSGALEISTTVGGTTNTVRTTATGLVTATPYVLEVVSNGTSWQLLINGVNQALTVVAGSNAGAWFGSFSAGVLKNLTLCALKRTTTGQYLAAESAGLVILDGVQAAGNLAAARTALGSYVGLSL